MEQHKELIAKLSSDLNKQNNKLLNNMMLVILLTIMSLIVISIIMMVFQEFRPGGFSAALDHPRYLAELLFGLAAIGFLSFAAVSSSIPGTTLKSTFIGIALTLVWLVIILSGFIEPILEPSMAGKREYCYIEALLYSIPLIIIFSNVALRRYSTRPWLSASLITGSAAIIPAYIMQIACMYEVNHALTHHLLPVLVTILLFTPVVAVLIKNNNK